MWSIGVLALVLTAVSADTSFPTDKTLLRLRRSPHYHCDPQPHYDYHPPSPHYFPPPPNPPQHWPPPPQHHGYSGYSRPEAYKEEPVPEPASEPSDVGPFQGHGHGEGQGQCKTCHGGAAVSNAETDHGDAIAVAVARSG